MVKLHPETMIIFTTTKIMYNNRLLLNKKDNSFIAKENWDAILILLSYINIIVFLINVITIFFSDYKD